jgi:hypothetical protein
MKGDRRPPRVNKPPGNAHVVYYEAPGQSAPERDLIQPTNDLTYSSMRHQIARTTGCTRPRQPMTVSKKDKQ